MPKTARTKITIDDFRTEPMHKNDKGMKVGGNIYIDFTVEHKRFKWKKTYMLLEEEISQFTLDAFKTRIYRDSRIWIKEKELEKAALQRLQIAKNETIYLD